jgi:hypothetical protein
VKADKSTSGDARGRTFQGHQLEGADFSGQDVRGVDFTGANLRSASFRDAAIGVPPRVGAVTLAAAILLSVGAGLGIGWAMDGVRDRVSAAAWDEVAEGVTLVAVLVILVVLIIWRGFDLAIRVSAITYVVVLAGNIVANLIWEEVEYVRIARATVLLALFALAVIVGILGRVIGGVFGAWSIAVVALLGGLASGRADGGMAGILVAASLVIISKRALRGDRRDHTLRLAAHRLVRRWGTRFVNADLTGADFTGTDSSRCDVRGATIVDVTWDTERPRPVDFPED